MQKIQSGFTLIELMIVVAIIGILAAISIPQYGNYSSRTNASGSVADLRVYKLGIAMCRQITGSFAGCDTPANSLGNVPNVADTEFLTGLAIVPAGNNNIAINATSTATTFAGVALTISLAGSYAQDDANINWVMGGTICDGLRGIPLGEGDC